MSLSAADLGDRFPAVTAHLGGREVEALAGALVPVEVVAGTTLIAEGGLADTLYFLARGELQVWIDVAKTPRPVSRLEPGSIVGEVALMDPGPASATVTAATPATLYALRRDAFEALAAREPHLGAAILRALCRMLAERLRTADDRINAILGAIEDTGEPRPPASEHHGVMEWFGVRFGATRRQP